MDLKLIHQISNTIRQLSMEAVQRANSGHPGLPMGCAEFGAYLYGYLLRHNPKHPQWLNRDRFILSAGHGSMLLYSLLCLAQFPLTVEDLKQFRQLGSRTPGHPECHITPGVEATTGPLGQGVANAMGQALGLKILGARFNRPGYELFSSKVYCLAGDGCIMEGVSAEASSLAGHLRLDNLVLIYDANNICLDGPLKECCSEDTAARYRAYGWAVYDVDGYDLEGMDRTFSDIVTSQSKPCLVILKTVIGKGAATKSGTHKVHGSPLGKDEVVATKKMLGLPDEEFAIPSAVQTFFSQKLEASKALEERWNDSFHAWRKTHPELAEEFDRMRNRTVPHDLEALLQAVTLPSPIAGRAASQAILELLGQHLPQLIGGSADLSCSDLTLMKPFPVISPGDFRGRNIKYGVREFAMGAAAAGLAQTGMVTPFVGTFLVFSDYMRNAIRLAALSRIQVIYQFTHDSIFLGEDGPTHQPIEQLASLRAIPGLHVIRPADAREVSMAWIAALRYQGPTALVLSRQPLPDLAPHTSVPYHQGVGRGAYIALRETGSCDFSLFATGSELSLALEVAQALVARGKGVRVVSMPCWELFKAQDREYQDAIVGGSLGVRVSIEAGSSLGWHMWVGREGVTISVDTFGESAPQSSLASHFGFTVEAILHRLLG